MTIEEVIENLKCDIEIDMYIHDIAPQIAEWLEELKRWRTSIVNKDIKNPFANTSTLICHNCHHKDEYIVELEIGIEDALKTVRETKETTVEIITKLNT